MNVELGEKTCQTGPSLSQSTKCNGFCFAIQAEVSGRIAGKFRFEHFVNSFVPFTPGAYKIEIS